MAIPKGLLAGAGVGTVGVLAAEESAAGPRLPRSGPNRKPMPADFRWPLPDERWDMQGVPYKAGPMQDRLAAVDALARGKQLAKDNGTAMPTAAEMKFMDSTFGKVTSAALAAGTAALGGAATHEQKLAEMRARRSGGFDALAAVPTSLLGTPSDLANMLTTDSNNAQSSWRAGMEEVPFAETESAEVPFGSVDLMGRVGASADSVPGLVAGVLAPGLGGKKKVADKAAGVLADLPLRDVPVRARTDYSPKDVKVERRVKTTGDYRGGPEGMDSPQKLGAIRKEVDRLTEKGAPGRGWYRDSSGAIFFAAGDRPGRADQFGGSIAATSIGTGVNANTGFGIKGYNQNLMGHKIHTGQYPNNARPVLEGVFSGSPDALGWKSGPFDGALSQRWNPQLAGRATHDIWQGRLHGYTQANPKAGQPILGKKGKQIGVEPERSPWDQGFKEAQHRFLDRENARETVAANAKAFGGFTDWDASSVQAAQWVAKKAEEQGISIEEASKHYGDFFSKNTARVNVESMPGPADHLPSLREDRELASEYDNFVEKTMRDPQGRDRVAMSMGALVQPSVRGVGDYVGRNDPVTGIGILAGGEALANGTRRIDPASRELLEGVGASHGILLAQNEAGISHLTSPGAAVANRNFFDVDLGKTAGPEEYQRLTAAMPAELRDSVAFVPHPGGLRAVFWGGADPEKEKQLVGALKAAGFPKATSGYGESNLIGSSEGFKPSAYLAKLSNPVLAEGFDQVAPRLSQELLNLDKSMDAKKVNGIVVLTRKVIANEGLAGLRKAIKSGAIPAAAGASILAALEGQQGAGPRTQEAT